MEEALVSVLCTAYNHENYIRQCLEGIVSQKTDFPFQAIVHDDASTDHTAEIIKEYELQYPHIIHAIYQNENQMSQGVPVYRKYILPLAKSKYIAFCEGDDYWVDNLKLQKQISFLEEHPEYSAAVHNVLTVDRECRPLYENNFGNEDHDFEIDGTLYFPQTSCFVLRNPWVAETEEGKRLSSLISGSDSSYILYMFYKGKVRFFSDYMSHYRLVLDSGDSHSARKKRTNLTEYWIKNELSLYRQIEEYQLPLDISPHIFKNMCIYPFMFFVRHPNLDNLKLYIKARRAFPFSEWVFIKQLFRRLVEKLGLQ